MHGSDTSPPDRPEPAPGRHGRQRRLGGVHGPARITRAAMRPPSRRAIVGGLLVAAAAVIAWTTVGATDRRPERSIVVATRAIAPGDRIDPTVLSVRSVVIDEELARQEFDSLGQLDGAVALGPIAAGDAIARSSVLTDGSAERLRQFSFPVDRDRSLNGELRPGERVDVMATYGSGSDAVTTVIARDALVLRTTDQRTGTIGSSTTSIITIGLSSSDQVLDAVHAAQVADLTVVRATLADDDPMARNATSSPSTRSTGARP